MLIDEFIYQLKKEFRFQPTRDQQCAIDVLASFLADRHERVAMVLRGSAGTGKTSLAAALVRTMAALGQKVVLMAPTGRAAKVFSLNAGLPATTIHKKIYLQRSLDGSGGLFSLNYNKMQDTLFLVDESSMIASEGSSSFGSGSLLSDLIRFVYEGRNCRLIFIGDQSQLPPVGETESPALQREVLEGYGLTVYECDISEVLRQSRESGILWNATHLRMTALGSNAPEMPTRPRIRFYGFSDIHAVSGEELIETLASSYSRVGIDETIVITRSNKRANIYNQGIRRTILDREEELTRGDRLMVVKNKYLSANGSYRADASKDSLEFIANGDTCVVQRVRNIRELYGFRFADVCLQFPDYDHTEIDETVILDTLQSEAPALTREQQEQLFQSVMTTDYSDIPTKAERIKKIRSDKFFTALQVKYAYAMTCHKTQGGQWAHVYIDQGYMTDDMVNSDYYHWLYTAITRATECVYLVNWRKEQTVPTPEE